MGHSASNPFVARPDHELANTEPLARGKSRSIWASLPFSPLAEMSARLKGSGCTHFFRLSRQRADYFADVEDVPPFVAIDEQPTQRADVQQLPIDALETQLENLPAIEQATGLLRAWG